jgi:hypothetical protein
MVSKTAWAQHSRSIPEGVAETSKNHLRDGFTKIIYIHTYQSRFILEGVAEASFYQNYLAMRNTIAVTGGKSIAV